MKPIGITHPSGNGFLVDSLGQLSLLRLPSFDDCPVHELIKIIEGLPEGFGLLIDGNLHRFRILEIPDAGRFYLSERGIIENLPNQRTTDDLGGEILKTEREHSEPQEAHPLVGDNFFIIHSLPPILDGYEK